MIDDKYDILCISLIPGAGKTSIEKLLEIVLNPLVENEAFKEEYVNQEKQNVKL